MAALVLDKHKKPLMGRCERRARRLLTRGWAVVVRRDPFPIRLKDRVGGGVRPVRVKLDAGRKTTGIAGIAGVTDDGNQPATSHALDAACVGAVATVGWEVATLEIKVSGDDRRTNLDRHGFPRGDLTRAKVTHGFKTGDMARAKLRKGKNAGRPASHLAVRATGSSKVGKADGSNAKYCERLHRLDSYGYHWRFGASSPCLKAGASARGGW